MLEKAMRMNHLYDFYQALLTEKQRRYMAFYYLDDYSLGEIAEEFGVSRQAVYDNLKRTEAMLEDFEEKLLLYAKYERRTTLIDSIKDMLKSHEFTAKDECIKLLDSLEKLD